MSASEPRRRPLGLLNGLFIGVAGFGGNSRATRAGVGAKSLTIERTSRDFVGVQTDNSLGLTAHSISEGGSTDAICTPSDWQWAGQGTSSREAQTGIGPPARRGVGWGALADGWATS